MARPIRKLVQLVLDRKAAQRTESDAKKSLSGVERGLQRLKSAALKVGAAIGAAFAVRAVVRFGKEAVRVAAEAEAIWVRLAGALDTVGVSFEDVEGDIKGLARAMQDATTVGDEDFAQILTELVTTSGKYEESLQNVGVVADLAAAKQIDFKSAAMLVGRAMVGQTATLTRYGIVVEEGADAIEVIRQKFAGMAANEAKSFEGQMKQLNNEWGDFKEAIGDALIAASDGESALERLTKLVKSLTQWVERNSGMFEAAAATVVDFGTFVGWLFGRLQRLADIITGGVTVAFGTFVKVSNLGTRSLLKLGEAAAFVSDIVGAGGLSESIRDWTDDARATVEQNLRIADAFIAAGKAALEGGEMMDDASSGAPTATTPTPPSMPSPGAGGGGGPEDAAEGAKETEEGIKAADVAMSALNQTIVDHQERLRVAGTMARLTGDEYGHLQTRINSITTAMRELAEQGLDATHPRMQALAEQLREAQQEAQLTSAEMMQLSGIAVAAGDLLGAAFGSGIGDLAAAKAKQNAIMAAEQAVQGLVASTNPFTAPLAAVHYKAAAQYAAISAAWAGLAGATGGFSGGGGAGASAGATASRGTGQGESERAQPAGNELHVHFVGPGFDAVNPEVQRVVWGSIENARERVGENAKVRIHRRSRQASERA